MELMPEDLRLIAAVEEGLPFAERPYLAVGRRAGMSEAEAIDGLRRLQESSVIKRFGVVVRHRELGYSANAMVVWDIADEGVGEVAQCFTAHAFVTLCYRRPRRLPDWPYNLFCMIHGREHAAVLARIEELARAAGVRDVPRAVLFSRRRFKQRGAIRLAATLKEAMP